MKSRPYTEITESLIFLDDPIYDYRLAAARREQQEAQHSDTTPALGRIATTLQAIVALLQSPNK